MTAPRSAREGCTAPDCGTQDTATVDGVHGRRCAAHPPVFDPTYAVELTLAGALGAGFTYARTPFPQEA